MNLTSERKWIQKELESINDPEFIEIIKNILQYRKKISEMERVSINQYNKELDEAAEDIENGEFYTHTQAKNITKEW